MTDRISEIESRLRRATAGPWAWCEESDPDYFDDGEDREYIALRLRCKDGKAGGGYGGGEITYKHDADFIAACRQDVPYLLERLRQAEGVARAAREFCRRYQGYSLFGKPENERYWQTLESAVGLWEKGEWEGEVVPPTTAGEGETP